MAVVYEQIEGTDLVKAYSDTGHKIVQDGTGAVYDEAVDPDFMNRTYTESDEMKEEYIEEISDEDALRIIMEGEDI